MHLEQFPVANKVITDLKQKNPSRKKIKQLSLYVKWKTSETGYRLGLLVTENKCPIILLSSLYLPLFLSK